MSLDRLKAIEHLFAPTDPRAKFSIWHAVSLRADTAPEFKIYLNPQAQGRGSSGNIVARTLSLLGFPNAVVPRSERSLDEIKYISLDMSNRPDARIKLYAAHHDATVSDIEAALRPASYYVRGEATDFCLHMAGQEGPYTELPVQTCLAYAANREEPLMGTVHFPVRSYAPNDEIVRDRILEYLGEPTAQLYRKALESFSNRPLNEGVGMQTYASLRQQEGGSRMTVYLSPELYSIDDASEMPMSLSSMSMTPISRTTLLQGGDLCPVSGGPASGIMSSDSLQKFRGVTSKNGTG